MTEMDTLWDLLNDRRLSEAKHHMEDSNEVAGLLKPGDDDIEGLDLIGLALFIDRAYWQRCNDASHKLVTADQELCEDCDADRLYAFTSVCRFIFMLHVDGVHDITRLGRSIYGLGGQHP